MKKEVILSLTKKDFKFDWFSGTGSGGRFRNRHCNCLRLTHVATNTTVIAQSQRTRKQNQKEAMEKLIELITPWLIEESNKILGNSSIKREENYEEIRIYHDVDNYVKDKESGFKISFSELDKKFDELIVKRKHAIIRK